MVSQRADYRSSQITVGLFHCDQSDFYKNGRSETIRDISDHKDVITKSSESGTMSANVLDFGPIHMVGMSLVHVMASC